MLKFKMLKNDVKGLRADGSCKEVYVVGSCQSGGVCARVW